MKYRINLLDCDAGIKSRSGSGVSQADGKKQRWDAGVSRIEIFLSLVPVMANVSTKLPGNVKIE